MEAPTASAAVNTASPGVSYREYLNCLNHQNWKILGQFVHPKVVHNGRHLGLAGYEAMLRGDHAAIPDLHFAAKLVLVDSEWLAAQLEFQCTPSGELFGLPVDGRRVRFSEHAYYRYEDGLICEVRSVIDTAAIAAQLTG